MDWATRFRESSKRAESSPMTTFGADASASTQPVAINHMSIIEQVIAGIAVLVIGSLTFALFRRDEEEIRHLRKAEEIRMLKERV